MLRKCHSKRIQEQVVVCLRRKFPARPKLAECFSCVGGLRGEFDRVPTQAEREVAEVGVGRHENFLEPAADLFLVGAITFAVCAREKIFFKPNLNLNQ